jgi:predicted dehydrogenase
MQNWYFFTWMCGDHINEQHIHNIDIANWFLSIFNKPRASAPGPLEKAAFPYQIHDATPVSAQGMGGRQQRVDKKFGQIYDHHYVEFTYANGVRINSQCRHQTSTNAEVREEFAGTKGILYLKNDNSAYAVDYKGQEIWRYKAAPAPAAAPEEKAGPDKKRRRNATSGDPDPYFVEHYELQAAIRNNTYLNNAYYTADSTMTAIMGRMATYSGKKVTWDEAYGSKVQHMPAIVTNETEAPVKPDADGWYPIAIPGVTKEGII